MYDCHTHTFFSDGVLGPAELIRRAEEKGLEGIVITDHVDSTTMEHTLENQLRGIEELKDRVKIEVAVGCELTHVPPESIDHLAKKARKLGAQIIGVHGETTVEPVAGGTNRKAVKSIEVDFLAHPGLLNKEIVDLAEENEVYLELTARGGHARTNGHILRLAGEDSSRLVVHSDAHGPADLITTEEAELIVRGAGHSQPDKILQNNERLFREAVADA
ncbi:MAG: histidinol phosphate phosphatase domain-containing protein [bacterium]